MSDESRPWGPVVREIMNDREFLDGFPQGVSGGDIYDELVNRGTNVATSASLLDVIDYMTELYGPANG